MGEIRDERVSVCPPCRWAEQLLLAPRWPPVLLTRGVYDCHCNAGRSFCLPGGTHANAPGRYARACRCLDDGITERSQLARSSPVLHCASAMHAHTHT